MSLYRTLSKMNGFLYNRSLLFKKGPSEEWKSLKFRCKKKVSLDFPKSSSYNIYAGMQNSRTLIFRAYKTLLRKNRQEYRNFWQESLLRCYIFLGLSKVEKQLHIEGNHFLFSFHAMHLRQKTKPRKVAHILLVARPRRPLYHQASVRLKPLFLKNATEMKYC